MKSDARGRRIVLVTHCLLNQNAKVAGLATHPGIFAPLLPILLKAGVGLVQLPCPECAHLGPSRPRGTDTVEQYDTPAYRAACAALARKIASEALAYRAAGYAIPCVLGVEGSPSCGVARVPRLGKDGRAHLVTGMGLFMRALDRRLKATAPGVLLLGIPESPEAGDLAPVLLGLRKLLGLSIGSDAPRSRA